MTDKITTNTNDVLSIPQADLPLMVLSDDLRSFLAWGIKAHEKGVYNHFMWMASPGRFISQAFPLFHEIPATKYLKGRNRLKFIRGKWDPGQKEQIISELNENLNAPWYKRLYDPLQLLGIGIHLPWLQIPGKVRICSDWGYVLKMSDPNYNLKHPSPTQINKYTKNHKERYEVYLRFIPD